MAYIPNGAAAREISDHLWSISSMIRDAQPYTQMLGNLQRARRITQLVRRPPEFGKIRTKTGVLMEYLIDMNYEAAQVTILATMHDLVHIGAPASQKKNG